VTPLAAPGRTVVMHHRRRALGSAVFFGVLTFAGVGRELTSHSTVGVILALVVFGGPFVTFLIWGTRDRPVLMIDQDGLTLGRSGRRVRWETVAVVRVSGNRGLFGESHSLIVTLNTDVAPDAPRRFITTNANDPDELEVNLDLLDIPWTEVVAAVERASGRRVIREGG